MSANRTALYLVGVAATMLSLSFAAVPFYKWFCRVTGYGGTTTTAAAAPEADRVLDRTIRVRFDASVDPGMPWVFTPMVREMDLRIGETGLAFYEARNTAERPVAGTAVFNVTPETAGRFFTKIACFCLDAQVLQPGEVVQMPVTFYVDPEMVTDPEGRFLKEITLSYTFYETDLPEEAAAIPAPAGAAVN
jgi:cytochrome c oxidase assembly protein subunit 11